MKKVCPDLAAMSDEQLQSFWREHLPQDLKYLGDRLLAESLPRNEPRAVGFYPDLKSLRRAAGLTPEAAAEQLGVTRVVLNSWEQGFIQPPASLSQIYPRLKDAAP